LSVLAQSTAGSPTGHALIPHANPDGFERMKTLQIGMFWGAGTGQGFR
jgi:hypothetical protein